MIVKNVCLVTGARAWTDQELVDRWVASLPSETLVIHGGAQGLDQMFAAASQRRGLAVLCVPADWRGGLQGGHERNQRMVNLVESFRIASVTVFCHAFLHGEARGTRDCLKRIRKAQLPVTVHEQITGTVLEMKDYAKKSGG